MHGLVIIFALFSGIAGGDSGIEGLQERFDKGEDPAAIKTALLSDPAPTNPHWNLLLAEVCIETGENEEGVQAGRRAVELLPESARANFFLAANLSIKMQKNPMTWMGGKDEFLALLKKAVELDSNFIPPYIHLIGFHLQAPEFIGASKEKAHLHADALIRVDRKSGLFQKSRAFASQGKVKAQLETLDSAIREFGEEPAITREMGIVMAGRKEYREAIKWFDKFPDDLLSLYQSAKSRILTGIELETAVVLLDRYLARAPANARPSPAGAWWRKGQALESLKRIQEARSAYQEAYRLDANLKVAKQALEKLN